MCLSVNVLNRFNAFSNNLLRKNHTSQGPLTILSEDEQFFKETGLIFILKSLYVICIDIYIVIINIINTYLFTIQYNIIFFIQFNS